MTAATTSPDGSVDELLARCRGCRVFFQRLPGNNGDLLIEAGTRHAFRRHDITLVPSPELAEMIVINGGGAMNDIWMFGLEKLERLASDYPRTSLVVLPSSFRLRYHRPEMFEALSGRGTEVTLFCREQYSLEVLRGLDLPADTALGLDHDMAFQLRHSDFIRDLRDRRQSRHILIVERADAEGATGRPVGRSSNLQRLRRLAPPPVRALGDGLVLGVRRSRAQRARRVRRLPTEFARASAALVRRDRPDLAHLPTYYLDTAKLSHCSYRRYCELTAQAACIVTTRLHVGILGSMLDKPTYCKRGAYHKIKGVYEYSMAEEGDVHLI
jgi:exopolysaccharide biosynthesis predicted pyruvyltransferase EpsI